MTIHLEGWRTYERKQGLEQSCTCRRFNRWDRRTELEGNTFQFLLKDFSPQIGVKDRFLRQAGGSLQ